jgi:hypothetical protein
LAEAKNIQEAKEERELTNFHTKQFLDNLFLYSRGKFEAETRISFLIFQSLSAGKNSNFYSRENFDIYTGKIS